MQHFPQSMMPFDVLRNVAQSVQFNSKEYILATIDNATRYFEKRRIAQGKESHIGNYANGFAKLYRFIAENQTIPPFSIFAEKGNSKLPFVAFSSLPGVTCPGAGECLQFCYSFKAWRTSSAYMRQAQNAYILRFKPQRIVAALDRLMLKKKFRNGFDLRLYVDGDFSSVSDFALWQGILKDNPAIRAYGYSKSFSEIMAYANSGASFASNYVLNVSSGHNHDDAMVSATKANTSTAKAFACPGQCNTCTSSGHACGSMKFKGITIGIAVH